MGTVLIREAVNMAVKERTQGRNRQLNNGYTYDTDTYVSGNTVRKLSPAQPYRQPAARPAQKPAKQPKPHATMSVFHMMVLVATLAICAVILVNYIQLRSQLTTTIQQVNRLESQANNMGQDNQDTYNRIMSSIDLEEIKRIAIGELGMTYASQGQIVVYEPVEKDYMRAVY